ncbi:girdin-like, partial [Cetorhinus maximus]
NYKLLEEKLESVFKETLAIRETHITNLRCQLDEAVRRNQELSDQLQELKRNLEQAGPREEAADQLVAMAREAETPLEMKPERRESIKEAISDRLIEVERENATLLAEKGALTSHVRQLETQNTNLQAQILMLQKHTVTLQEQSSNLQTLNAQLQVDKASLLSQNTSLTVQTSQLQSERTALETEGRALAKEAGELRTRLDSLLRDHEKLVLLHESQEAEFERLIQKHSQLKGSFKSLEVEQKELEERYSQLLAQKARLDEMETAVKRRQEALEMEADAQKEVAEACQKLQGEYDRLIESHADCERRRLELRDDHRALRSQLSAIQVEKARSEAESNFLKDQNQQLDIRMSKLSSQCELLNQLKGNLEEENRHLLHQIKSLTEDNRALLEKTVESKDQFHEEQRQYMDKLSELRREKQKLVEKIMDQYRVIDPAMPRRKGNWIADKMKKLIKPRKEISKDQLRTIFINTGGSLDSMEDPTPPDNSELPQTPSKHTGGSDTLSRQTKGPEMEGSPEAGKVQMRARRKLSSRIYGSETPRQRFRQRRVGWCATGNEEEEEE